MSDVRLRWDMAKAHADIVLLPDGTLDMSGDLETMTVISLFSDRRASSGDRLPTNQDDPRGWWGDFFLPAGDHIGSRAWLLENGRSTLNTPVVAQGYFLEGLQWMPQDGIAASAEVQCSFPVDSKTQLDAIVTIHRGDGSKLNLAYDQIWRSELKL